MLFETIATGLRFPEGPVYLSDDHLLVTEVAAGIISDIDLATGTRETFADTGGGPNGLAVDSTGALVVCNNGGLEWRQNGDALAPAPNPVAGVTGSLQRLDPVTRELTTVVSPSADAVPVFGPNDIVFDTTGGYWFTDCGHTTQRSLDLGGLYYVDVTGRVTEVVQPMFQPNGVGLSPDGTRVYVAETCTGRLWYWNLSAPGEVVAEGPGPGGATLLHGFAGYAMLDSLAVDADGNVCVATLNESVVSVVSPDGELLERLEIPGPDRHVTNVCFGGADLGTMFVTSGGLGRVYAAEWKPGGLPLAFNL